MWRHRAQHRSTPVASEAVIAGLASEGLALLLGSAEAGTSAVVGPTSTDPVEFRKCARDLKALSEATDYTTEERGGGRNPGVRRPGVGRGQFPARSKIFDGIHHPGHGGQLGRWKADQFRRACRCQGCTPTAAAPM